MPESAQQKLQKKMRTLLDLTKDVKAQSDTLRETRKVVKSVREEILAILLENGLDTFEHEGRKVTVDTSLKLEK